MRCRIFSIEALFLALLCTFSFIVLAQSNEVDWNLDRVTCHEVGAVLTFNAMLNGAANAQTIRLSGLPSDVDVANAQIALPDGMRLISTKRFAADADMDAAISRQEKQVEARRLALDLEMALLAALNQEQAFLEANRNIAGNDILLVDDVEEMRNYVVERHEALELERVDLKSNIRGLERVLADEEAALAELLAGAQTPSHTLELVVAGGGSGLAEIRVATQQAGWVSSYDLAWNDQEGTLNLGRYAQVIQTTGTDWRNVQLELRTGRPLGMTSRTQERPKLHKSEEVAFGGYFI